MPTNLILQYLEKHGERLDTEIANATATSLATVRLHLAELTANGAIKSCQLTRFVDGKKFEGMTYRLAGFIPKAGPGRKAK